MKAIISLVLKGLWLKPSHLKVLLFDLLQQKNTPSSHLTHLQATLQWSLDSWLATDKKGSSAGYSLLSGWKAAYPETTGYLLASMLDAIPHIENSEFKKTIEQSALAMADWELDIQLPSGAVRGGVYGKDPLGIFKSTDLPVVFNTGMVLMGWMKAYQYTQNKKYLIACEKACAWLMDVQEPEGYWLKGKSESTGSTLYTYYTMVAWGMAMVYQENKNPEIKKSIEKFLQWTLDAQSESGYFKHMSFDEHQAPFTHTIAYTLQGLFECGLILEDQKYLQAVLQPMESAYQLFVEKNYLPGTIQLNGRSEETFWCCTGNAQFAIVAFHLFLHTKEPKWAEFGKSLNVLNKQIQFLDNPKAHGIYGGIRGSFPIWQKYIRMSYPNWAAKFFIDALLLEIEVDKSLKI